MDEGDFLGGNALCNKFLLHVVIDGEVAGRHGDDLIHIDEIGKGVVRFVLFGYVLLFRDFADKRAVHIYKRFGFQVRLHGRNGCRSLSGLGRGQIAEDELRSFVRSGIAPDFMDTLHSGIEL